MQIRSWDIQEFSSKDLKYEYKAVVERTYVFGCHSRAFFTIGARYFGTDADIRG